jgi:hypothetical protein
LIFAVVKLMLRLFPRARFEPKEAGEPHFDLRQGLRKTPALCWFFTSGAGLGAKKAIDGHGHQRIEEAIAAGAAWLFCVVLARQLRNGHPAIRNASALCTSTSPRKGAFPKHPHGGMPISSQRNGDRRFPQ